MNVINLSLDKKLLNNESRVYKRHAQYAKKVDRLFILVNAGNVEYSVICEKNLVVIPIRSFNPLFYFINTLRSVYSTKNKYSLTSADTILTVQDPFITGMAGFASKYLFGFKLNIQDHSEYFSNKNWVKESLINRIMLPFGKLFIKKSDSLRVVSPRENKYWITRNYSPDKIFHIPIYLDMKNGSLIKRKKFAKNKNFNILYTGRFEKEKNIPLLINSFHLVKAKYPGIMLTLVGSGAQMSVYNELVYDLDLGNNLTIIEWTDNIRKYYLESDLFVLPSNYEGWGMSVVEAVYNLCPVIMTDTGCADLLIKNGQSGWVVPFEDKSSMSAAIIDAYKHPDKRQKFAINALARYRKLPDKENIMNQLVRMWKSTLC